MGIGIKIKEGNGGDNMKRVFYVYTESFLDARKLLITLYRPSIDKVSICIQELWEDGECLEIERDTEIWRIFKR